MGRIGLEQFLLSSEETIAFGKKMAHLLKPNAILALSGDLGSGKTTFVQGLALGLGIEDSVQSPTFVTLNLYEAKVPLFHFDLYRLKSSQDFLSLGFEEYFQREGICAIEWPERIASLLPQETVFISFEYSGEGRRAKVC
ncbi:MAG TPA: tRNA (adenosine(37)-N6)-threonylcarbamoyltransferase complex ATPase subunit type 1 TsaE [Chlamydiales bacterium]|nr:tRNA (adenosine(37)-N6)-threonylcarbamoyltransferase complex ATPase subunit type 1 TsaE [Chlamydiales bacterium]